MILAALWAQVHSRGLGKDRHSNSEGGYAMVVLLVSLSVMAVMMSVAMPVWKQTAQREKETELVFRGEQYARAIALFQRKHGPGTLPPSINVLVEERFIRKKFKDPITNDDFAPILQGVSTQGNSTGQAPSQQPQGQGRGLTPTPPATSQQGRGAQPAGNAPGTAFGGVTGVASKSKEKSIRLYKGRNHYNEWQFVYTPPAQAPGTGGPNAPGVGGQRGRGNQSPTNPQGGTPFPPGMRGGPGDGRGRGFGAPPDGRSGFPPFGPTSPSGPPRGTGPLPPGR
jgi:type II secretory pathway pseudopilin PulG